jgi:H(+)-translocating pyrophosphatase
MATFDSSEIPSIAIIYSACALSIVWAIVQAFAVKNIKVENPEKTDDDMSEGLNQRNVKALVEIGAKIENGANAFLFAEYKIMAVFTVLFGILVYVVVDITGAKEHSGTKYFPLATVAFVIGAITSIVCGYIGMKIAVMANYRTTFMAIEGLAPAFSTAFRAGCVMGFGMVGLSLGMLISLMLVYIACYGPSVGAYSVANPKTYEILMDLLSGYGLGGSSMALFGRVGGGIYTKAADVGADLVGKVEEGLDEDSPRNPATIADNVGDNVGDIAGMGSDLFGSFAEATCAALVLIASDNTLLIESQRQVIWYPLMISAMGIFTGFITSLIGIFGYRVNDLPKIQRALNLQLLISTVLMLAALWGMSPYMFDSKGWEQSFNGRTKPQMRYWYHAALCGTTGLVSGFLIGISTDYYTSNSHKPVREMAEKCTSGAAINVIYGLAVGYLSTIIPITLLSITVIANIYMLDMLGVALGAIGMLSTLTICLAIDAYGPIADNAGGICEMAEIGEDIREKTDALDAAGNTTAAVGKGFAIGSAALVSLALYGAFIVRAQAASSNPLPENVRINDGWVFGAMFFGAMLPYWFSAMTMKSVGLAANEMVEEVRRQFRNPQIKNGEIEPDYQACIEVSTKASLREMIAPGCLVMLTPIIFGCVFGTKVVAGVLPGALLSGIQLAISMSNTGGAWDNAKKYIESGQLKVDGEVHGKGSDAHTAAVIGDTIGDPLKDTSGPALNILVKLMAIISLVFANGFAETSWLAGPLDINGQ